MSRWAPYPNSLLPDKVAQQADDREDEQAKVKDRIRPQARHETLVFPRDADEWGDQGVQRKDQECEEE